MDKDYNKWYKHQNFHLSISENDLKDRLEEYLNEVWI